MSEQVAQLLLTLFDGSPHALSAPVEQWLTASKRFRAFVQSYQAKIRKKIRICRNDDETLNLYCELRTAWLLLQEPRFTVAYEAGASGPGRSPDFAVADTTQLTFHVEVTRLHRSEAEQQLDPQLTAADTPGVDELMDFLRRNESRRLTDVVCDKCDQMAPDAPNVLWVWGESRALPQLDVGQVMHDLKRRAEQSDAGLFARHGYTKPADFIRGYQRLSAIVVASLRGEESYRTVLWWQNNDARHPLPARVASRLAALLATESTQSPARGTDEPGR